MCKGERRDEDGSGAEHKCTFESQNVRHDVDAHEKATVRLMFPSNRVLNTSAGSLGHSDRLSGLTLNERKFLTVDGTITSFVAELIGEPVVIDVVDQHDLPADPEIANLLAADAGALLTNRRVVAIGQRSRAPVFCAVSRLRFELLPAEFIKRLQQTPAGLGAALEACGVLTKRELLCWGTDAVPSWAVRRGLAARALTRTYRFLTDDQPFALVTEWFPAA